MYTPDQPTNPPEDQYKTCIVCNGRKKVVPNDWDYDEYGEPEEEDLEGCTECDGEGSVKIEPWENEW